MAATIDIRRTAIADAVASGVFDRLDDDLKTRYRAGKVGDVEVKNKLAKALNAHLEPMRARRADIVAKPDRIREILHEGSRRARAVAQETMERVRAAVKLKYS